MVSLSFLEVNGSCCCFCNSSCIVYSIFNTCVGCGPHKFMQKSQDFLVYQLSGQRVRFQAETVLSSDNVSWGIFQGESGLNNGEIANLYRSGTFQRVGKEFKVELLNVTFGGILSKWIFGKRSDNENVYAKIGIGGNCRANQINQENTLTIRCFI